MEYFHSTALATFLRPLAVYWLTVGLEHEIKDFDKKSEYFFEPGTPPAAGLSRDIRT